MDSVSGMMRGCETGLAAAGCPTSLFSALQTIQLEANTTYYCRVDLWNTGDDSDRRRQAFNNGDDVERAARPFCATDQRTRRPFHYGCHRVRQCVPKGRPVKLSIKSVRNSVPYLPASSAEN